jgi:hypothetical protein
MNTKQGSIHMKNYNSISLVINWKGITMNAPCSEVLIYCIGFLIVTCGLALLLKVIAPDGFFRAKQNYKKTKPRD